MPRRRWHDDLRVSRSWVWAADAERRWVRAFRLLLTPDAVICSTREPEEVHGDEQDRGRVRSGLDRAASRAADD